MFLPFPIPAGSTKITVSVLAREKSFVHPSSNRRPLCSHVSSKFATRRQRLRSAQDLKLQKEKRKKKLPHLSSSSPKVLSTARSRFPHPHRLLLVAPTPPRASESPPREAPRRRSGECPSSRVTLVTRFRGCFKIRQALESGRRFS